MYELLGPNSYFIYDKEIEYLFVALEHLSGYGFNENIKKVYQIKKDFIDIGKFRWLYEIFQNMKSEYRVGFLEFFIYFDMEKFSLKGYEEFLISLPKEEFLAIYFQNVPKEEIHIALENEKKSLEFFEKYQGLFSQYLVFQLFMNETKNFIHMFFDLVKSLKNEKAEQYLESKYQEIMIERNILKKELEQKDPFLYSEELIGKNCYNRGLYYTFYFMPSVFFPLHYCRVFGKDQALIYDYQRLKEKKENVPAQLKAMSDNTRYKILLLLKEEEHLTGIEIAKKMKLATSTVSHHMNNLRDSGLVHEEPKGATKCYSISRHSIENCIKILGDTFLH